MKMETAKKNALLHIEPYFDGKSTPVILYKVVDENGTVIFIGKEKDCEYFIQHS